MVFRGPSGCGKSTLPFACLPGWRSALWRHRGWWQSDEPG
ncbi:hypothetical protein OK016_28935 [Vibrio chagasii]|nr:hypothetical protein [Vibrio chagasii]